MPAVRFNKHFCLFVSFPICINVCNVYRFFFLLFWVFINLRGNVPFVYSVCLGSLQYFNARINKNSLLYIHKHIHCYR